MKNADQPGIVSRFGPNPDRRFYMLDEDLLRAGHLSALQRIILIDLFHRERKREAVSALTEWAEVLGCSKCTLIANLKGLVSLGHLLIYTRVGRGQRNLYLAAFPAITKDSPEREAFELTLSEKGMIFQKTEPEKVEKSYLKESENHTTNPGSTCTRSVLRDKLTYLNSGSLKEKNPEITREAARETAGFSPSESRTEPRRDGVNAMRSRTDANGLLPGKRLTAKTHLPAVREHLANTPKPAPPIDAGLRRVLNAISADDKQSLFMWLPSELEHRQRYSPSYSSMPKNLSDMFKKIPRTPGESMLREFYAALHSELSSPEPAGPVQGRSAGSSQPEEKRPSPKPSPHDGTAEVVAAWQTLYDQWREVRGLQAVPQDVYAKISRAWYWCFDGMIKRGWKPSQVIATLRRAAELGYPMDTARRFDSKSTEIASGFAGGYGRKDQATYQSPPEVRAFTERSAESDRRWEEGRPERDAKDYAKSLHIWKTMGFWNGFWGPEPPEELRGSEAGDYSRVGERADADPERPSLTGSSSPVEPSAPEDPEQAERFRQFKQRYDHGFMLSQLREDGIELTEEDAALLAAWEVLRARAGVTPAPRRQRPSPPDLSQLPQEERLDAHRDWFHEQEQDGGYYQR